MINCSRARPTGASFAWGALLGEEACSEDAIGEECLVDFLDLEEFEAQASLLAVSPIFSAGR